VAHAQSTATQTEEVIITGHRTPPSTGGLATHVDVAKDEAIIQQQFIATQIPSANVATLINMLPGVSWSTEDPYGLSGGDLRIHGFDGNHVAFILDGAPLNDTGNYAVYPGEYMIGELIDHITVNIGSSDVDSPSASALGATINVTTKTPPDTMGGDLKLSTGSFAYGRAFGELDTGIFTPWGTKAFVAAEDVRFDNYEGRPGANQRRDVSGDIYQPLQGTDFMSVSGIFAQERLYPPYDVSQATIKKYGFYNLGENSTWTLPTVVAGKPDTLPTVGPGGNDTEYYALFPNPVDFSSIRGSSKFTLGHGLTFTFDPAFFYTLANGGGGTSTVGPYSALSETAALLRGGATAATVANKHACISGGTVTGVDLNGDGDCLDNVVVYAPSNTQTFRYTINSSLLYDFDIHNHFQLGYTFDYGQHRQTGEYTYVDQANGDPDSIFGAKDGYGTPILDASGNPIQKRNRRSIAELNQISFNYIGKFLDDRLHIDIGIRAPFFNRSLNNYCDTYSGTTVFCNTAPLVQSNLQADYNADVAAHRAPGAQAVALTSDLRKAGIISGTAQIATGPGGVPDFRFPFTNFNTSFSKPLPNVGISYRLTENNFFYASYAAGFAAPKTDDLYSAPIDAVHPESSDNYAIGYRFETRSLYVSVNPYYTFYRNRIEQTVDPNDPLTSIDRNVGNAIVYGVDIESGWTPIEHLHLYGSANFNHSALQDNYSASFTATNAPFTGTVFNYIVPAKGKELVLTPEKTFSARISYDFGPITVGAESKYISKRYVTDINDASIGGYAVFNVDMRYNLPFMDDKSYLQLNIQNLFNREYVSRATTSGASNLPIPATATSPAASLVSTTYYYAGAPSSVALTLNVKF
jgi:iron complex outermembrane receptor protein